MMPFRMRRSSRKSYSIKNHLFGTYYGCTVLVLYISEYLVQL